MKILSPWVTHGLASEHLKTGNANGTMHMHTTPAVSIGTLNGLFSPGYFILSYTNYANSNSIPRA